MTMGPVPLTLAIHDYDHVRDLASGAVGVEGVALRCLHYPVEEIFFRFTRFREWDASELSLAKYCSLRAAGDRSLIAIPVFSSRAFRHSAIFVRADGPVDDPAALAGARIGVPEWTQTATVYGRGILAHEYGLALEEISWVQAGTNEPGRVEGVAVELPPGISLTAMPDATLDAMLLAGELDAVIAAHPPRSFGDGGPIVRLFSDYRAVEEESLAAHRRVPDHARRRAPRRGPRARPVDRDEPPQRVRGGQAAQRRARAGRQRARVPGAVGARQRGARPSSSSARTSGPTASRPTAARSRRSSSGPSSRASAGAPRAPRSSSRRRRCSRSGSSARSQHGAREDRAQIGLARLAEVVGAERVAHRRGDHRVDVRAALSSPGRKRASKPISA